MESSPKRTKVSSKIDEVCLEEELGGRCASGWKCRFPGCIAMFTDRKCMVAHEQVHAGQEIFACAQVDCGYKAVIEQAVIEHIRAKHLVSGEPWRGRKFKSSKAK